MTCIITDDEQNSRETLRHLINAMIPDMVILAEAKDTSEAKRFIDKLKPDILFLDINMPNQSGIEFVEENFPLPCQVIFTTAYNEHAIKAFRLNAIDFLLKPIDPDELESAINKCKNQVSYINKQQIDSAKAAITKSDDKTLQRLAISTQEGIHFIQLDDIIWLESMGSYTKFGIQHQTQLIASKGLIEYENLLSTHSFLRVHQSSLINIHHIKRYIKGDGGQLIMSDDKEIEVSRRKKEDLLEVLKKLSIN